MSNKCSAFILTTLVLCFCNIVQAQTANDIDKLTGIWVRKDIVQRFQTTQSFFQVKKYAENQPFTEFMAVGINYNPQSYSRLSVNFTQFGAIIMPPTMFLYRPQKSTNLGYRVNQSDIYKNYVFHLSFKEGALWIHVQKGKIKKWLIFEKMATAPIKLLYGKFKEAQRQIIKGSYELRDANNQLIQPHVWFDRNGLTNFPKLHRYEVRGGYWNSVHNNHNAYKLNHPALKVQGFCARTESPL